MAIDKSERLNELRKEMILLCAAAHFEREQGDGRDAALEWAKSHLIGAVTFLEARLGKDGAHAAIDCLRASI